MSTELTLFLLRMVSGALLVGVLALLFVVMWHDYRSVVVQVEASRRTYGRLIEMRDIGDSFAPTGQSYPLLPLTSFGRSPTNTIAINDNYASGEHALVALRSGQWWLEDRQSRNGTTINGMPITQPVIITDGDIIGIGSLSFRLELEQ
ncbi:MAG: FHA domain-containing protein [Anaerolineae bacterium]|nr:FHA domain-containing protein [Anaerolineae bacterium]